MPPRPLVLLASALSDAELERRQLGQHADLHHVQTNDESDLLVRGPEADLLLVSHDMRVSERTIERLGRCKAIVRGSVGVDNIDIEAAGRAGIVVCNVPDYGTEDVADHALMLLIAAARRLREAAASVREGVWDPLVIGGAPRLRGKTLGILGCGRIGSAMALRAKALGMDVVIYDPYQPDGLEKALGVRRCEELAEMLPQAAFLSLHCPLTRETYYLLNRETLGLLPPGAYVVNTARGSCIDLSALMDALDEGRLGYAALDVVEREPLDDERLRRHPKVLLTPHAAFYTAEGFVEMRVKAAREAERIVLGKPYRNAVNLQCLVSPRYPVKA